ncbi:MAG: SDR family NAD(P)-dependent oxidoreductase [Proteobacteria bacterium]|nr:SDR family NAD(P)-dependent oxidoreductase [Pseudomonadota bacterium]
MELSLAGQLALVTGASRGIGAATAQALAQAGAHVVLVAREANALEAVEEAIHHAGGSATIAPLDLAEPEAIARLATAIAGRWRALDVLVNAAAHFPPLMGVADLDGKTMARAMTVNSLAVHGLIHAFHPLLKRSENARVVHLTTSVAGEPRAWWGAYGASKAAADALLTSYAEEVRNTSKIRVAMVNPGATRTKMRAEAYPGEDPQTVKEPEVVATRLLALLGEDWASPHHEKLA